MTEERKQKLRQLLCEAMENLEIRPLSSNSSQSPSMDVHNYRRRLQQRWTFYSESPIAILMNYNSLTYNPLTYNPHIVSETIKSKLLDFIREEFARFIHEEKILPASFFLIGGFFDGLSIGFPIDRLLDQLMKIAIARGIEEAVLVFDRGTEETHGFFQDLVLLEGIKLKTEIQMFEGIRLLPLPNSTSELLYYLPGASYSGPENFFSGKTLLVIDYFVSPILHKPLQISTIQEYGDQINSTFRIKVNSKDFANFKIDDFPLNLLCQALSLACHSAVRISFDTTFLAEDKLYNLSHGVGGGGNWHFRPPGNVTEAGQHQIDEAKRLFNILINLDSSTVKKLQIPIDRWIKSAANKDFIDKIIDLGIALEALYLFDRDGNSELSFQFRLRASWYLGRDKADREMLIDEFKAIYTLRSKAVHIGELPQTVKIRKGESVPISEFIPKVQDLCRQSIIKILEAGEFPDWNSLILGAESL